MFDNQESFYNLTCQFVLTLFVMMSIVVYDVNVFSCNAIIIYGSQV